MAILQILILEVKFFVDIMLELIVTVRLVDYSHAGYLVAGF